MGLPVLDESGIRLDFIFSRTEYEKQALRRVNKIKINDEFVNYALDEDVIIHKVISGRERDIEDVKGILLKNRVFDEKYVLKWLGAFEKTLDANFVALFLKIKKKVLKH